MTMITPDTPIQIAGDVIRGEGRTLALRSQPAGWGTQPPTMHLTPGEPDPQAGPLLSLPPTRLEGDDGQLAVWELTIAQVDALTPPKVTQVTAWVSVGDGDDGRSVAAGTLLVHDQGQPLSRASGATASIIVAAPGAPLDPEAIAAAVADWLDEHPATPPITDITLDILADDATPTASLTDGVLELAVPRGLPGTPGADGTDGVDGDAGADGADGLSAYQLAVGGGFVGDETAWLASLHGAPGAPGEPSTEPGPAGRGIASVTADGTTATVTYTDATISTFVLPVGATLTPHPTLPGAYLIGD